MTAAVRIRKMVAGLGRALPTRSTASMARTIAPFFSRDVLLVFAIKILLFLFFGGRAQRPRACLPSPAPPDGNTCSGRGRGDYGQLLGIGDGSAVSR